LADLEQALKIQRTENKRHYHVRVYTTLGDGYWKINQQAKALAIWNEGIKAFPDEPNLKARLSHHGADLQAIINAAFDFTTRVDTNLSDLWRSE
jgi:hypothetical protein